MFKRRLALPDYIYAIGIGPGDPELITIKAAKTIKEADIVIVPQSNKTGRSVALEIVKYYTNRENIFMYHFPMVKNEKLLDEKYSNLANQIENFLKEGKKVAYVTIGDLSIYSTFNYLHAKLKLKNIDVVKISGIPAFIESANRLQEHIVVKNESFCVIEMSDDLNYLENTIKNFNTVIIMKVYKKIKILENFVKNSKSVSKAYLISRCSMEDEKIYDLTKNNEFDESVYLSTAIVYGK